MTAAPKVFISHASEDKDRFVLGLATKLRDSGVDAWLDKWEMLPGDSLVDKIFEADGEDAGCRRGSRAGDQERVRGECRDRCAEDEKNAHLSS